MLPDLLGMYWEFTSGAMVLDIPHGTPLVAAALLPIVLRPKPRWRFKLYEFFVITAIVAVNVGGYVAFTRAVAI